MTDSPNVQFNKPYALEHVPIPSPGPYDLLLRVGVASYCHTDSMVVQGTMGTTLPCTASHEGAGTVVRTGSSISQSDFKPGDRVMAGIPHNRCQKCESCTSEALKGYRQYCPNVEGFLGVTTDGAFADYMLADARDSVKVPDGVGFEIAAPMACAGSTVYRAVLQARVKGEGGGKGGTGKEKDQETLGIVGAGGGLGHLGVKFAKAMGIRVVALDARDEGLALAKESGADVVVDARGTKEDVVKQVQDVTTGSKGVDATINLSDHETAAALSCAITKAHGTMIQIAQVSVHDNLKPLSPRIVHIFITIRAFWLTSFS